MGLVKRLSKAKIRSSLRRKSKSPDGEGASSTATVDPARTSTPTSYEFRVTSNPKEYSDNNEVQYKDRAKAAPRPRSQCTASTENSTVSDDDSETAAQTAWRWLSLNSCFGPLDTKQGSNNKPANGDGAEESPTLESSNESSLGSGSSYYHSDGTHATGESSEAPVCMVDQVLQLNTHRSDDVSDITSVASIHSGDSSGSESTSLVENTSYS